LDHQQSHIEESKTSKFKFDYSNMI
jgi:hypothetical protein